MPRSPALIVAVIQAFNARLDHRSKQQEQCVSLLSLLTEYARVKARIRGSKRAELRNAIVHDRGKAPVVLADPREDVVVDIENIWGRLSRPRSLRTLTRSGPLHIFDVSTVLAESLSYMREHDFSQVIVLHDGRYSVLSTEGIARWLEAKSKEDIIALSEARLSDALTFEPKDSCVYLKVNETVDRARQIFVNDIGKRIFSALITEHGTAKEKPVNIITPWDLVAGKLR